MCFQDCFGASEVTRQTVTGSLRAPPLVKDIETTTLYTQVADGQLDAVQVSAYTLLSTRMLCTDTLCYCVCVRRCRAYNHCINVLFGVLQISVRSIQ
jgi:hypothetical protein